MKIKNHFKFENKNQPTNASEVVIKNNNIVLIHLLATAPNCIEVNVMAVEVIIFYKTVNQNKIKAELALCETLASLPVLSLY